MWFRKHAKQLTLLAGLLFVLLFAAQPAQAFEGRNGADVTIPAGETVGDDLIVTAQTFTLEGTVEGDVVAMASVVTINGTVQGDLISAARDTIVNGTVQDDVRTANSSFTLAENGRIGDDVIAAGYSFAAREGTAIGGEALVAGNQALLAGDLTGDANVAVNGLEIQGTVAGDVNADVTSTGTPLFFSPNQFFPNAPTLPTVASGLTVAEAATIEGNLDYTSETAASVPAGAVSGNVNHEPAPTTDEEAAATGFGSMNWLLDQVRSLAALLIVGLLLVWLAPHLTERASGALQNKPLPSLGWGFVSIIAAGVALIGISLAMILVAAALGWISLNGLSGMVVLFGTLALLALTALFIFAAIYVAKIVVSYLGGRLILAQFNEQWAENRVLPLVLGLVSLAILAAIPFLGTIVNVVVVLLGLGALWLLFRDRTEIELATDKKGTTHLSASMAGAGD